jgi:hypothetical protein
MQSARIRKSAPQTQEDCASDRRSRAQPPAAETLGKGAQTESISKNVESSNFWAFFQAKSIRRTMVQTRADQAKPPGRDG